ncbi:TadE/TadG family type IV pilus assembly protein [Cellulosimicrobium cellulans]|uniref:TadE/TadG family type IV pilus assembly protein n=1 Tax=Cellulosimicrobium cellulans TaxID=1710 RepID=UPI0018834E40|nr:TadE/TadG family type IV pilus assembly protein [Cellulosimicrobium cellulans]MBE9938157.1 pilus assembly protein [Cellulosimicrobium cellulans]
MTRLLARLRARLTGECSDRGSAVVEFLGVALVLLLPVLYLVLTVGRVQAATFAVEGASREAARAFVTAPSSDDGARLASAAVALALGDQGFAPSAGGLTIACSSQVCLEPGGEVTAHVRLDVPLPLVPELVRGVVPLAVPVEARHVASVDAYAARRP